MTDPQGAAPVAPQGAATLTVAQMLEFIQAFCAESNRSEPPKDKKPTQKKRNEPNKKLEALKKKAAEDKAKLVKTRKELRDLQLLAKKEKANKRVEKRKSLMERDQEIMRIVDEKLRERNNQ